MTNCLEEIQTWLARIDESGCLQLPEELRQKPDWAGTGDVVLESDGVSLRVLPVTQYAEELLAIPPD